MLIRIRLTGEQWDGWEGDVHPAEARALIASEEAVSVDPGSDQAASEKPKRGRKPKAQPVETAAAAAPEAASETAAD